MMRPVQKICLLALALSCCQVGAIQADDKKPEVVYNYSCKATVVAGLRFNGSEWEPTKFKPPTDFFLSLRSDDQGYEIAIKDQISDRKCRRNSSLDPFTLALLGAGTGNYACSDDLGLSVIFNRHKMRGGMAHIFGAADDEHRDRDDLIMYPFFCVSAK